MQKLRVSVIQFTPSDDRSANLAEIRATAATLSDSDLIVLPEYSSSYVKDQNKWAELAEPIDGEFASAMISVAGELGLTIVAGLLEAADGDVYNTVAAFTESGIAASYRKVHLYDAFGAMESETITAGDPQSAPAIFEINGWRIGLQTCYDLRFPEISRRLIDVGAEVLVVPSDWVPGDLKIEHWKTLLGARAIENTCWVVAADHANSSGIGLSAVVSPSGVFVELAGSGTETLSHVLNRSEIETVRKTNPALANRRFRVSPA